MRYSGTTASTRVDSKTAPILDLLTSRTRQRCVDACESYRPAPEHEKCQTVLEVYTRTQYRQKHRSSRGSQPGLLASLNILIGRTIPSFGVPSARRKLRSWIGLDEWTR